LIQGAALSTLRFRTGADGLEHTVPALILGNGITVLGVARSLGAAGIPAFCVSCTCDYERFSRYCRTLPQKISAESELPEFLGQLPFQRAVLIPCSDHWTLAAAALDPHLKERFPASLSSYETQSKFVDKNKFRVLVSDNNLPHPLSLRVDRPEDLEAVPRSKWPRLFLKPCDSQGFFAHYQVKAWHVDSPENCWRLLEEMRSRGFDAILQEYIPGPPTRHYYLEGFLDRAGNLSAICARQRLRMCPHDFGNTTAMVSIAETGMEAVREKLLEVLRRVSYRG
jgi:D-aspartate ligase